MMLLGMRVLQEGSYFLYALIQQISSRNGPSCLSAMRKPKDFIFLAAIGTALCHGNWLRKF